MFPNVGKHIGYSALLSEKVVSDESDMVAYEYFCKVV